MYWPHLQSTYWALYGHSWLFVCRIYQYCIAWVQTRRWVGFAPSFPTRGCPCMFLAGFQQLCKRKVKLDYESSKRMYRGPTLYATSWTMNDSYIWNGNFLVLRAKAVPTRHHTIKAPWSGSGGEVDLRPPRHTARQFTKVYMTECSIDRNTRGLLT